MTPGHLPVTSPTLDHRDQPMTDNNAFERFWSLGYTRLVPIVPPTAEISEHSTLFKRIGTTQDARGKVPGTRGRDSKWTSFDWGSCEAELEDLRRWHAMGAGVGIKMGNGLAGIDADTLNTEHARVIRDEIEAAIGRPPVRIGQYPKALYLVRLSAPMPYTRIEFGTERVEVLTEGRQFVAAGIHPKTGKPYTWPRDIVSFDDLPVVDPSTITAILERLRGKLPAASKLITEGGTSTVSQAALKGTLDAVRRAVEAIPNTSNHFPSRESYRDVGYAIKAALPDNEPEALDIFQDWCARWTDGTNDPDVVAADWARMKPAYRRGASWLYELAEQRSLTGFSRADVWFEPIDPASLEVVPNPFSLATPEPETSPPLRAGTISLDDLASLPPREWLYGFKILRKYVTFIASPGGVGKTALTIAMALACAANKPLVHDEPRSHRPLRVWLFNLEDDIVEIKRRISAALHHYGLPPSTLEFIRVNSGRDRGVKIVKLGSNGDFLVQPDFGALISEINREQIDIAIFDPFLRTYGLPENANEAQDEVMRLFASIAEATNCGIVLVHHTKKGAIAGDIDSLRGGSTQGGGARAAFTLTAMSPEEAAKLGIKEEHRRAYVRIDDAKQNMAPSFTKAEWMRLSSYNLGNATEDYPRGDEVQVATAWSPPGLWEGAEPDVGEEILNRIEDGLGDGERFSHRIQDKERWAGMVMVDEFGRSPQQAKEILDGWLAAGVVEVREYASKAQRKTRKGLFVRRDRGIVGLAGGVFD